MGRWINFLLGRDPTTGEPVQVAVDKDDGAVVIHNKVYDPTGMNWNNMQQPNLEFSGDLTVTMGDLEKIGTDFYFQRLKIYYDGSDNAEYLCRNTDIDALETDTDWFCWKLVYDGNNNMIDKEGPRQGAVNVAPSGLGWNI